MSNRQQIASILAASTNEGLDAFMRGLKACGFEQAAKRFSQERLEDAEESGLLGAIVELLGTVGTLSLLLQDVALASMKIPPPAGESGKSPGQ